MIANYSPAVNQNSRKTPPTILIAKLNLYRTGRPFSSFSTPARNKSDEKKPQISPARCAKLSIYNVNITSKVQRKCSRAIEN